MSRAVAFLVFSFSLLSFVSTSVQDQSLETCLHKDSISCVQIQVYKKLVALLSQRTINLLAGFQIVKEKLDEGGMAENLTNNNALYSAVKVTDRQLILEDLIFNKVFKFFKHRTIRWNLGLALKQIFPTARKLFSGISENMKQKFIQYVNEGRGKKKFMRLVVPVIIAFKMTIFTWVKVIYLGVALIAKKAFIISIIALMVAIFVAIKKHSYKEYRQPHYEIHGETIHSVPYYPVSWPSGGHSVHSGHDSYDTHASGSAPAHYLAYAAQKPNYS